MDQGVTGRLEDHAVVARQAVREESQVHGRGRHAARRTRLAAIGDRHLGRSRSARRALAICSFPASQRPRLRERETAGENDTYGFALKHGAPGQVLRGGQLHQRAYKAHPTISACPTAFS